MKCPPERGIASERVERGWSEGPSPPKPVRSRVARAATFVATDSHPHGSSVHSPWKRSVASALSAYMHNFARERAAQYHAAASNPK